jgi:hypothetical protein
MGSKPNKQITDFMDRYKVDADEIWEVRSGAWAIKHLALERVAAEQKITFDRPAILEINLEKKLMALCVFGTFGDRTEWSIGESAPYNTKPGYPGAMAEKRAKDRVILKLLNAHGTLYSEEEADEFKRPNPHVTKATDIVPDVEYDDQGHPVDNIPLGEDGIERLPKAKAKEDFAACQKELRATTTVFKLEEWGKSNANRIATFPHDWAQIMRGLYSEHMTDLRAAKQAAQ